MGINCCKNIIQDNNDEIQSDPNRSKRTNSDAIIKNSTKINNSAESTNQELVQSLKQKNIFNKELSPIKTNDYAAVLFQILNNFRDKPTLFCNEAIKYELKQYFDEACRNKEKPSLPEWSTEKNKLLHDYLTNPQNNDKTSSEKEEEILEMFKRNANGLFFQSIGPSNNLEANIWNLLENNPDEINRILTQNFQKIIIASVPIEGTDKLHSTYVFLLYENSFILL